MLPRFHVQVKRAIESNLDWVELVKPHWGGLWSVGELGWCQGLGDGGAAKLEHE